MGKIRFVCAGRRELSILVGQERRSSHFGASRLLPVGILCVFVALALGLRRREGHVLNFPLGGGLLPPHPLLDVELVLAELDALQVVRRTLGLEPLLLRPPRRPRTTVSRISPHMPDRVARIIRPVTRNRTIPATQKSRQTSSPKNCQPLSSVYGKK